MIFCIPDLLSVFDTEMIIYDNGSIRYFGHILVTLFCPENVEYPSDKSVYENCIDPNLTAVRKTGPRQLSPFPATEWCAEEIGESVLKVPRSFHC